VNRRRDERGRAAGRCGHVAASLTAGGMLALWSVVGAAPVSAGPPAVPQTSSFLVVSLTSDRTDSAAAAYAAATRANCSTACPVLLRSSDGGHSWLQVAAKNWGGSSLVAITIAGQQLLFSADRTNGLELSRDQGGSFTLTGAAASGSFDVSAIRGGLDAEILTADASAGAAVLDLQDHATRSVPGSNLEHAALWLTGATGAAATVPALASGEDPATKLPVVERCSVAYACAGSSAPLAPHTDAVRLYVSPHFSEDRTVLAATSQALLLSTDGGLSFSPVQVLPPSPELKVTAYPQVAFTPDFDAASGRGHVYVAVYGVLTDSHGYETTTGGIFHSHDGRSWLRTASSLLDHGATGVAVIGPTRVIGSWASWTASQSTLQGGILCADDPEARWDPSCPPAPPSRAHSAVAPPGSGGLPAVNLGPGSQASMAPQGHGSTPSEDAPVAAKQLPSAIWPRTLLPVAGVLALTVASLGATVTLRRKRASKADMRH